MRSSSAAIATCCLLPIDAVDDDDIVEAADQEPQPTVDLPKTLLAEDVLGILRAVAERGSVGHLSGDLGALDLLQELELSLDPLDSIGRDVVRWLRHGCVLLRRKGSQILASRSDARARVGRHWEFAARVSLMAHRAGRAQISAS